MTVCCTRWRTSLARSSSGPVQSSGQSQLGCHGLRFLQSPTGPPPAGQEAPGLCGFYDEPPPPLTAVSLQSAQVGVGGLSGLDADPAVYGLDPGLPGDDGTQLEFGDLRQFIGHPGDP